MILALVLAAQICGTSGGTMYRVEGVSVHCLDWEASSCQYVERPCRSGEVSMLCPYFPVTCPRLTPVLPQHPNRPKPGQKARIA